jgi:hypothetical protein
VKRATKVAGIHCVIKIRLLLQTKEGWDHGGAGERKPVMAGEFVPWHGHGTMPKFSRFGTKTDHKVRSYHTFE